MSDLLTLAKAALDSHGSSPSYAFFKDACMPRAIVDLYSRIAELEEQNALQAEAIVSFTAQIKALELEALEERASYEAERQRLREALPPLSSKDTEVHDDLRKWADTIEQAREEKIDE